MLSHLPMYAYTYKYLYAKVKNLKLSKRPILRYFNALTIQGNNEWAAVDVKCDVF
jgi:hypothetical protein